MLAIKYNNEIVCYCEHDEINESYLQSGLTEEEKIEYYHDIINEYLCQFTFTKDGKIINNDLTFTIVNEAEYKYSYSHVEGEYLYFNNAEFTETEDAPRSRYIHTIKIGNYTITNDIDGDFYEFVDYFKEL